MFRPISKALPALTAALATLAATAPAAVFTWNGGGTDYATSTNWTPARTAPAASDDLVFPGGTWAVANIPTQTIATLAVQPNSTVRFDNTASAANTTTTLTVGGGANAFNIAAAGSLTLGGGNTHSIVVALPAGGTGTVSGDLVFNANTANTPHRVTVQTVDGLSFANGATCAMAPGTLIGGTVGGAQGGFNLGTSTTDANNAATSSVRFLSGSTYYQGGLKSGLRNGGTGSNPFTFSAPAAIVQFNPGSTYVNLAGIPSSSGRRYANFIWRDGQGAARDFGGGGTQTCVIDGDFTIDVPGGSQLSGSAIAPGSINATLNGPTLSGAPVFDITGNWTLKTGGATFTDTQNPTSDRLYIIRGNWTIDSPALFTPSQDTDRFYVLRGAGAQTLNANGDTITRLNIENTGPGVTIASNVTVSSRLALTTGVVNVAGGIVLTGPDTPGLAQSAGWINGALTRVINAETTGGRNFPVGDATSQTLFRVELLTASTTTGSLTVSSTAGDHPSVPTPATALNRFWSATPAGLAGYSADVTLNYRDSELGGANENAFAVYRRDTGLGTWNRFGGANVALDPVSNTAKAIGVTNFANDWTLYEDASSVGGWSKY